MASALDSACRSAEELLDRCIQVNTNGTTTWVDPATSWENIRKSVLSMLGKKNGSLAYVKKNSIRVVIQSADAWKDVCAEGIFTAPNGGSALELEYIAPATQCGSGVADGCPPSKCCPPTKSSACKPKPAGCCSGSKAKVEDDEVKAKCVHPKPGDFTQPKDCRPSSCAPKCCEPSSEPVCVKCPEMFPKADFAPDADFLGAKPENPTLSQFKYSGSALRCCQLPLGPLGGGSISVSGDGGLRQWQVQNEVAHTGHVPDSFWAVKVETGGTTVSKVLQSDAWYDNTGFHPAYAITDHVVPPASIDLLKKLPGVPEIEITAKYPVVEMEYPNSGLPVDIRMTAFNPCIPQDTTDSGLPIIIFNFEVTNPMGEPVQVSLLNSQQNLVGWDTKHPITGEVYNPCYGGNSNSLLHLDGNVVGIDMINSTLIDPNGRHYNQHDGHFVNAAQIADNDVVSTLLQYDAVEDMWAQFTSAKGLSGQGASGPSPAGRTWNGALAVSRVVPAQSKTTFTFFLAWHFPHRYTSWQQPGTGHIDDPPLYVGNYYGKLFPTITDVLHHTSSKLADLCSYTIGFRDAMYNSTLPWQLIDSAAGRVSVLRSPTCMWLGDGRFYAFEGCNGDSGCCPLNCTHVWNYEQALCQLWPTLERTMRDVDLGAGKQVNPPGRMLSRVDLPLFVRPPWLGWPNYDLQLADCHFCVDGEMGGILKLYREYRFGMSEGQFKDEWQTAKAVMKRWMTFNDQGDGTVKLAQPSTYDTSLYGVNTFIGSLYLCGLRACEEMAKITGELDLAQQYHERYEMGRESLDRKCWKNDQWYTQEVDPEAPKMIVSDGTFVDSMLGQWWGYILQLGDILPFDHCQSTAINVFSHNHRDSFTQAQVPRQFYDARDAGMIICTWPNGEIPANRLLYTTECAWTGLSHYFAGLAIYLGASDIGLRVLEDARNCYDGTRRSPWNEIECGDHYSRPMCAFQLFATASGLTFDLNRQRDGVVASTKLGFAPRLCADNFSGFFIVPTAWGQYHQKMNSDKATGMAALSISYGALIITELSLPFKVATNVEVSLDTSHTPITSKVVKTANGITLTFDKPVTVNVHHTLHINVSPSWW